MDPGTLLKLAAELRREVLPPCRIVDGEGDGLRGVYIDRFPEFAIVHLHPGQMESDVENFFRTQRLSEILETPRVVVRVHSGGGREAELLRSEGDFNEGEGIYRILEHGVQYEVRPLEQVHAGFFIDTRGIRAWLLAHARGKRVINTFCFTGSLGVAAYWGGAREVIQVDVSKGALTWAKRNYELNRQRGEAPMGEMRFIPEDAATFLEREGRRVARGVAPADIVIIDPPSFGKSARGAFVLEQELPRLIELGLGVVSSGGTLLVTSNQRGLLLDEIAKMVTLRASNKGLSVRALERVLPPSDFTSPAERSVAIRGAKALLYRDKYKNCNNAE